MDPSSGHGYYSPNENYEDIYFGFPPPNPIDDVHNVSEGEGEGEGEPSTNNPSIPQTSEIPTSLESTQATREKTSKVWQIFQKDDIKNIATCKLCKKEFKHKKSGGTGTLDRHIKSAHANYLENLLRQQQIHVNRS